MINFLTAEFTKLLKRKKFYISLAFITLASIANILVYILANPGYASINNDTLQALMIRFLSNKFVAILIVFIATLFIAESNSNTSKNAITIGYSRWQIFSSKILLGATILFILVTSSMVATFAFTGIWMYQVFTIEAFWEALLRFGLLLLVYITLFIISLSICYTINYNMLFAIIYFVIFLVFTEIVETASINSTMKFFANMTLTHQLKELIYSPTLKMWPYIVSSFFIYNPIAMAIGMLIINQKDIK